MAAWIQWIKCAFGKHNEAILESGLGFRVQCLCCSVVLSREDEVFRKMLERLAAQVAEINKSFSDMGSNVGLFGEACRQFGEAWGRVKDPPVI